jgi:hypothetical protein
MSLSLPCLADLLMNFNGAPAGKSQREMEDASPAIEMKWFLRRSLANLHRHGFQKPSHDVCLQKPSAVPGVISRQRSPNIPLCQGQELGIALLNQFEPRTMAWQG